MVVQNTDPKASDTAFERNTNTILQNVRSTLDPMQWKMDGLSYQEMMNNIARNKTFIAALTTLEDLEVTDSDNKPQKVVGKAISFGKTGDLQLGNKAVYLAMGGRVIGEFDHDNAEKILPALYSVDSASDLPVGKDFDILTEKEKANGKYTLRRKTSTHLIDPKNGEEERGFFTGVGTLARNTIRRSSVDRVIVSGGRESFQQGVNMTIGGIGNTTMLNTDGKRESFRNDKIVDSSGSFGQMLVIFQKGDEKGYLMVGMETSAYGADGALSDVKHNIAGKSGKLGAFWGSKHRAFLPGEYGSLGLVQPKLKDGEPINAMRAKIDNNTLKCMRENAKQYETFALAQLERMKERGKYVPSPEETSKQRSITPHYLIQEDAAETRADKIRGSLGASSSSLQSMFSRPLRRVTSKGYAPLP